MKSILSLIAMIILGASASAQDTWPVFHTNDVILFQGDSITDGGRARTGNDFNHTMGQDYGYIISARIGAEFPERNLTFINRGISGNTVTDLAARWQQDTLSIKPQFLSILIGVNDELRGGALGQYEKVYDQLLTDTQGALPGTKIILCEPFLLPVAGCKADYATRMVKFKTFQAAVARLAEKHNLPIIHFQAAFDAACLKAPAEHWSWDGIHPTYAGHGLMVQEWLAAVQRAWPNG